MVLPEWFFLDPNADTLWTKIDTAALSIMDKSGVKVCRFLPIILAGVFRGDVVHRILNNPEKRDTADK